jgi:peptide/nickel transport system substrate-binding protein
VKFGNLMALASGLCLIATTAACGASDPGATNAQGATSNTAGSAGPARAGGVLTIGAAQAIAELNPVTKANAWEQVLYSLMWDGLVKTGRDQKTIEPDLATSWKSSSDLKTWTFQLRSGVKFSDGTPLTASSVVSTIKYYQDPTTTTQLKNNIKPIETVEATGPQTVVFTLSAPNALFPASIEMVKIIDTAALGSMETSPAVTGPFKVKEFVSGDHLTLERNPDYFGTAPKLDGIKLVKAADASSAVTALQSGDLDALWSVPLSQVSAIQNNPDLAVVKPSVIGQYISWEVDMTKPPFDNPLARQALAYAIDQKAILHAAYYDQGVVSTTNDPLTTNNPAYGGNLTKYTYDLDKAKELFAKAGIHAGATFIWWGASNQYPEWNTSAQILQASLKKIGINLKIENTDIASWPAKFYPAGKSFPGLIVPNFQSYEPDAADEFLFLQSGRCECNWNSDQFDSLYNKALATADTAARNAIWHQLQEMVNKEVPIFVPAQFATVTATKRNVVGLWVDGGGNPHLEDAGFAG